MKILGFLFLYLKRKKRIVNALLSLFLSIMFFYHYYHNNSTLEFLVSISFLLYTIYELVPFKRKINFLKKLNKAQLRISSTDSTIFVYSDYKKYRNLLYGVFLIMMSGFLISLIIYLSITENRFNLFLLIFLTFLLFLFALSIVLIFHTLSYKIKIDSNSVSYQELDFRKLSLYKKKYFKDLNEIGIGKFVGFYYQSANRGLDIFEKRYYWLLYGIDNETSYIFLDFYNNNDILIFNEEWEKDVESLFVSLKKSYPKIQYNRTIRELVNPNPSKGDRGWTVIGKIK